MAVDLLLITWNREKYLEPTLKQLLSTQDDFNLYIWDNGSRDPTRDILSSIRDPRIVECHFHETNVKQKEPTFWFLDKASARIVGKIDDDVLLPNGWIKRIQPMISGESRFGMLGCCLFMPDEWDETVAVNRMSIGEWQVIRTTGIAGQAFLCRKDYLCEYADEAVDHGLPIDRFKMTMDGLISGYPYPTIFAENMDHPRSPKNIYTNSETIGSAESSLSTRVIGLDSIEKNAKWLRDDAYRMIHVPFEEQIRRALNQRKLKRLPLVARGVGRLAERLIWGE
jgi:glycosyltransferase involved in cell wall biosynthesis